LKHSRSDYIFCVHFSGQYTIVLVKWLLPLTLCTLYHVLN